MTSSSSVSNVILGELKFCLCEVVAETTGVKSVVCATVCSFKGVAVACVINGGFNGMAVSD